MRVHLLIAEALALVLGLGACGGDSMDRDGAGGADGGVLADAGTDAATDGGSLADGSSTPDGGGDADGGVCGTGLLAEVTVPGASNPWLAGMPDGATASSGDVAPDQSPALVTTGVSGCNLTFSATGGVHFDPGCPSACTGPDGMVGGGAHTAGAENGISSTVAPWNALMGVFVGSDPPNLTAPPAPLDFLAGGRDYAHLEPELKQVFFIGDGLTGEGLGATQTFLVPEGATRLYLGTMDGSGWFNNTGSFDVRVYSAP